MTPSGQVLFKSRKWLPYIFGQEHGYNYDSKLKGWLSDYVEGSVLALSKELYSKLLDSQGQVMDPRFFVYCEDVDLGQAVRGFGVGPFVLESKNFVHEVSASSGGKASPLVYYYITRNRILLAQKWLPFPLRILFYLYYSLSRIGLLLVHLLYGRYQIFLAVIQGATDGLLGRFGKWKKHDNYLAK